MSLLYSKRVFHDFVKTQQFFFVVLFVRGYFKNGWTILHFTVSALIFHCLFFQFRILYLSPWANYLKLEVAERKLNVVGVIMKKEQ